MNVESLPDNDISRNESGAPPHDEISVSLGSSTDPAGILGSFVTAIDHVGLAVRDLDEAIAFYQRAFGMISVHEEVNEEQGVREAMVAVGTSGSAIQLLAPLRDDSPIGKFLARNGEGIQQLAFRVTDIDVAADRLRAAGLRLLYDTPKRGTAGSRVNFVHPKDCGGVLLELVEPGTGH